MTFIQELRKERTEYKYISQMRMQAGSLRLLSLDIYTEEERFVYELLQNAIDAFLDLDESRLNIRMEIREGYFLFLHNGASFSERDVQGLCDVGNGSKVGNIKKVGYKGIGFKSVFMKSSQVYVKSGAYCFKFDKKESLKYVPFEVGTYGPEDVPWQIIPIETELPFEVDVSDFRVITCLRLERTDTLIPKIGHLLKDSNFLLFLNAKHIDISLFKDGKQLMSISRDEQDGKVILSSDGKLRNCWLLHSCMIPVTKEVKGFIQQNPNSVPEKLKDASEIEVSFAVPVNEREEIEAISDSVVYTFLPTSYGNLGLPFLVNSNFLTDAGRQQLQKDSEWNKMIVREIPRLFLRWMGEIAAQYPTYYKVLPARRTVRQDDALTRVFKVALDDAIAMVPFIPSTVNRRICLKASEAYIDELGITNILGSRCLCDHLNRTYGKTYTVGNEVSKYGASILDDYGVFIFGEDNIPHLFRDEVLFDGFQVDKAFELISFLYRHYAAEQFEARRDKWVRILTESSFLLSNHNVMRRASELHLPSPYWHDNSAAKNVEILHEDLYSCLNGTNELEWLKSCFKLKELSDVGFVQDILEHGDDRLTCDNAIEIGRHLFHIWKSENFLNREEFREKIRLLKFKTKRDELKPIANLYLGSLFCPEDDVESIEPELPVYISEEYIENNGNQNEIDNWGSFLKECGINSKIKISARYLSAEEITDTIKQSEDLREYPFLEDAASAFYLRRHHRTNYCGFKNPIICKQVIVHYFLFIDPCIPNIRLDKFVLGKILSKVKPKKPVMDKITGKIKWWSEQITDALFEHVADKKYHSFLEWALAEKQLFPTTQGMSKRAEDVFLINAPEIKSIASKYLPVLDIEGQIHDSWRRVLPFKEKLDLSDYLTLLEKIVADQGEDNKKKQIEVIYKKLIDLGYSQSALVAQWGQSHKILAADGEECCLPAELFYITIDGFKTDKKAFIGGLSRGSYREEILALLKTLGVRVIDQVHPEFLNARVSDELNRCLLSKVEYLAAILTAKKQSELHRSCVNKLKEKIQSIRSYVCDRIELSYGDAVDVVEKSTFAQENEFYYTGKLGLPKLELMGQAVCKYLGISGHEKELLVLLNTNDPEELIDYLKDNGYETNDLVTIPDCLPKESADSGNLHKRGTASDTEQKDSQRNAMAKAKEWLKEHGFECKDWNAATWENSFGILKGQCSKSGEEKTVVVVCSNHGEIYLSPYHFIEVMQSGAILLNYYRGRIYPLSFERVFANRPDVNLILDSQVVKKDVMAALARTFRYSKDAKFVVANPDYSACDELNDIGFGCEEPKNGPILVMQDGAGSFKSIFGD